MPVCPLPLWASACSTLNASVGIAIVQYVSYIVPEASNLRLSLHSLFGCQDRMHSSAYVFAIKPSG
eukprot:9160098-Lingulodinium_polyedra.AAC.1